MRKVQRRTTPADVSEAAVAPQIEHMAAEIKTTKSPMSMVDPFLGKRHNRVVVGIDGSLTGTALCFYDLDTGEHGVYRHKPKTKGVQRLIDIQTFVYAKCHTLGLVSDLVCMVTLESYAFGGQQGHSIGEGGGAIKLGLVQAFGIRRKIAYPSLVAPSSLKKFVTGKGNAEKSDMKMQVFKRWGAEFSDDNECDAFALAQVAACLILPNLAANDAQREVLAKVDVHAEWAE